MQVVEQAPSLPADPEAYPPPLENGERLRSGEFLRRYEAMPEVKKAELVEGKVYMGSPVRADLHGKPDALIQTWLGVYASQNPGVAAYTNTTLLLDADNTFQPDAVLCLPPERGDARGSTPKATSPAHRSW